MNKANTLCASSGKASAWNQINWDRAERYVKRLQARIVQAVREGRRGRVKALQWLLTHSFYAKALAVKRVTENKGKHTPGVDGTVWPTPGAKIQAIETLTRRGYKPLPLRRIYIPKANGKRRPLGIPTMRDRAMQALHLLALEPVAETTADEHSYGFRPRRSCADAIGQCFLLLSKDYSAEWVLECDIRGCFDNISHEWMLHHVLTDTEILRKWLKAGYIEQRVLYPTKAGTPQGGIISPTLANLTLDGLGRLLSETFPIRKVKGKPVNPKVNMVRYADDMVITGSSKELLENEVRLVVERFLRERGLELSPEKTYITHIRNGFDFLGQNLRTYGHPSDSNGAPRRGKLLIQPSEKNIRVFLVKVKEILHRHRTARQDDLIRALNPVIRGWAVYHRHVSSSRTFQKIREVIWKCLWRWAKRRHPAKGAWWRAQRYWHTLNGKKWVFAAQLETPDTKKGKETGETAWLKLADPTDIAIRRHVKIRCAANPFDPHWRSYFHQRNELKGYGLNSLRRKDKSTPWNIHPS